MIFDIYEAVAMIYTKSLVFAKPRLQLNYLLYKSSINDL